MEYGKVKSAAKEVIAKGPGLDKAILDTLKKISDVVGATLGPHGQPVLIERYEFGLPPMVTKDGVTVFNALGFENGAAHCLMEATRDAAKRTAMEAGDGTTTATILAAAIVGRVQEYCRTNRRESPQRVVRYIEKMFRDNIEPTIKGLSRTARLDKPEGRKLLRSVATISANGDEALADAVMQCFDITGDEGNVTIVESSGPSRYMVDQIKGYAIPMGYDESCAKFAPAFINDAGSQRVVMQKPLFLLYHGQITEIQTIKILMEKVGAAWVADGYSHNVVVVAMGFSESVLGDLAANFSLAQSINVFPLVVPMSPQSNGQLGFLQDLQAITGASILDPLTRPAENASLQDLGPGVESFECSRYRSSVIGYADPDLVIMRVDELNQYLEHAQSTLDADLTRERKAKLTGGIAKLNVIGSSNGELKEKKDRAEDAVCAVRGAIKHGCLPGGGWTLLKVARNLPASAINKEILIPALMEPFWRLVANSGVVDVEERNAICRPVEAGIEAGGEPVVYDFLNQKHVEAFEVGILDSTPAVLEAVRNSISIAMQMGTLGGIVVQKRDNELERQEAHNTAAWLRDANTNEADERA